MSIEPIQNKLLVNLLGGLGFVVTMFYWTAGTDPFNLTKMVLLVLGAGAIFGISLSRKSHSTIWWLNPLFPVGLFLIGLTFSFLMNSGPKAHMFYGVYGRNTGLLTYLALALVFFAVTKLQTHEEFNKVLWSLILAGVANGFLCTLEILGKNPQRVSGTFQDSLIGSFGNPNFVSAFLGITGSIFLALFLKAKLSIYLRIFFLLESIYFGFLIYSSNSIQGFFVYFSLVALTIFLVLWSKPSYKVYLRIYTSVALTIGVLSLAAVFNIGPLGKYVYKSSVGFRVEYWKAGLEMFKDNFLFGVGPNSYGDWYRYYRSESALISPGDRVTTNSAHNIYIDFAATSGILTILGYLFMTFMVLALYLSFKRNFRDFDVILDSMFIAWAGYLIQGFVSIDQIGLSIWGWILPAAIYSYVSSKKNGQLQIPVSRRKQEKTSELLKFRYYAFSLSGFLTASIIVFPVFSSDIRMNKAYGSGSGDSLIKAALNWPRNEFKVGDATSLLLRDGNQVASLELAKAGVAEFPRSFGIWSMIFVNPATPESEKESALKILQNLDPRNKKIR
jgi:O-antigen ligase